MNKVQKLKNLINNEKRIYKKIHNGKLDYIDLILTKLRKNPNEFATTKINGVSIKYRTNTNDYMVIDEVIINDCYKVRKIKNNEIKTIIDIGGFIGDFTLYANKLFPKAKIFVFEPEETNFKILNDNISNSKQIKTYKKAVSTSNTLHINLDNKNAGGHFLNDNNEGNTIETIGLDEIFKENKIEICDLLKIDCEGGEYDILFSKRFENYLKKTKYITMEYHITKGYSKEDYKKLVKRLRELGFSLRHKRTYNIVGTYNEDTGMIYAWNKELTKKSFF